MFYNRLKLLPAAAILLLAACGGSAATASNSPTPAASPSPKESAAPASIDPCQLVTAQEASQLAGASFGAAQAQTTSGGGQMCTYGGQTRNVFLVETAVASDAATAQADWANQESKAQGFVQQLLAQQGASATFSLSDISLSGADKAAVGTASQTISGVTINISAIYVLKGPYFFTFSDLVVGQAAPSAAAMQAQAQTSVGRLP